MRRFSDNFARRLGGEWKANSEWLIANGRGQRPEDRGQRTEVRGRRADDRGQMSHSGGRRSDIGWREGAVIGETARSGGDLQHLWNWAMPHGQG